MVAVTVPIVVPDGATDDTVQLDPQEAVTDVMDVDPLPTTVLEVTNGDPATPDNVTVNDGLNVLCAAAISGMASARKSANIRVIVRRATDRFEAKKFRYICILGNIAQTLAPFAA
jgi:hypothetical protein